MTFNQTVYIITSLSFDLDPHFVSFKCEIKTLNRIFTVIQETRKIGTEKGKRVSGI